MTDLLITAVEALEVAVDDYTEHAFIVHTILSANPENEKAAKAAREHMAEQGSLVVEAAVQVAAAMLDGDIDGAEFAKIVPAMLAGEAADAEIAMLHGTAKLVTEARCSRCAGTGQFITYVENGVPKGPGGICYRCNGKGVQTTSDRRRNYGHDNFAPIGW